MAEQGYPRHVGGGWYELSNGERVQGKQAAESVQAKLPRGRSERTNGDRATEGPVPSERELIFIAAPEAALRAGPDEITSLAGANVSDINQMLSAAGVVARPLFGLGEDRLHEEATSLAAVTASDVPDLSVYYRVEADDDQLDEIMEELTGMGVVDAAYIKPPAEPPAEAINTMTPAPEEAPPATPDFTGRQGYLNAAPGGVDAVWARSRPGGRGTGMKVIDIEGAWRFTHEDLVANQGGVVGGTQSTDIRWRNHGTAVIGEIGGDLNSFGVTGIAPDAQQTAISIFGGTGSSGAIRAAANRLRPGDIILIELHRPGPRNNFQSRLDQDGYIAIEWWEDDFAAIRYAFSRGVIVVEAAGNGDENLDDAIYNNPGPGFPGSWTNPFNRSNRDSGAIVVGAGAPPPGTHGQNHGPDRSRLGFSNYGSILDAQGWGREVTTTGYGDLQGGANEDLWYTDTFSGTSSASPIVVGVLASVQGMLRATGRALLTPTRARACLRATGSAQQDAPGRPRTERIGNRPDLPELWRCALGVKILKEGKEVRKEIIKERTKDLKDIKERIKEGRKEFKEFKEGGKEVKERVKELKEPKEVVERKLVEVERRRLHEIQPTSTESGLEARLQNLEEAVGELTHFIAAELRPDLSAGALSHEDDLEELGYDLGQSAQEAKDMKDAKDVEKLPEG